MTTDDAKPDLPVRRRRRRWVSVLMALLLLISGGVIGSGLTLVVVLKRTQEMLQHPEMFAGRAAERLTRRLDLNESQSQKVEAILEERFERIYNIRREYRPQVDRELDHLREDVAEVLNPVQGRKWRELLKNRRENWLARVPESAGQTTP